MKIVATLTVLLCLSVSVFAQPVPIEVMSHVQPDSLRSIKGPDGKILADGSLVYALHMHKGQPQTPKAGGLGMGEQIILKSEINPNRTNPGEIEFVLTSSDDDEFHTSNQALKNEKIFFRVFASKDTTLPKGTWYADSPIYTVPLLPGSIEGVHVGKWNQIP